MTELDLDRTIQEDRLAPLPGQPDANTTLRAVKHRVSLVEKCAVSPELRDGPPLFREVLGVAGMVAALGVAWVVSSTGSPYLLLVIPWIELVALMSLIKEGAKS